MPSRDELDQCYMQVALAHAAMSKAVRKKVGACLVTRSGVIIPGYNGTPRGANNVCEVEVDGVLVTKPDVIHAELNCVLKAAREGVRIIDSVLYVTLSPCEPCAAWLVQSGVKEIVYLEQYRVLAGIDFLARAGVEVRQLGD